MCKAFIIIILIVLSVTKEEVTIRMGSVFRDFGGRILSVVDIVRHPKYKMDQYYPDHNLALIKVKK